VAGHPSKPDQAFRYGERKLALYLAHGQHLVSGWLDPYSAAIIVQLSRLQLARGIAGGVGEIGVHEGKLMVLLLLISRPGDAAVLCDLFEQQEQNIDRSGRGNEAVLDANIARFCGPTEGLVKLRGSSLALDNAALRAGGRPLRLLSIDGGHTEECAFNDLRLADAALSDGGIAIVDDYFNEDWPDVSAGVGSYLRWSAARLVPFAITPNKLLLTTAGAAEGYWAGLGEAGFAAVKRSRMFGTEVAVYRRRRPPWPGARTLRPWVWSARSWAYRLAERRG
jgi:hypothetical protein